MKRHTFVSSMLAIWMVGVASSSGQRLSLGDAVALARQQAPTARMAHERVAEASARVSQTSAAFLPQLRVSSSYTRTDNPVQVFMFALDQAKFALTPDINDPSAADNWQLSAQAGYRLFSGGRDMANRRAARAAERGSRYLEQASLDDVTLQVAQAYLGVLTAAEYVRAAHANAKALEYEAGVIETRVSSGTALRTDLLYVEVERAQAEDRLLQATNGLVVAREQLRLAIGLDSLPYSEFGSLDSINFVEPPSNTASDRNEVRAGEAFAEAARAQLGVARSGYLPAVNAFASFDRFQGWEFDGTNETWTAGLSLEWSLFDGFLTRSTVRERRAQWTSAQEEARLVRLQTSVELATASANVQQTMDRIDVMTRAVTLATENATLTRQRFEEGLMLTSQVIDAENGLAQAEVGLAQAKADRLQAIATLRRALGLPIIGETR